MYARKTSIFSWKVVLWERSWVLRPAASIINYGKSSELMASSSGSVIVLLCDFEQVMPLFGPQCSYVWSEGSGSMASRVISRFHICRFLTRAVDKRVNICLCFLLCFTDSLRVVVRRMNWVKIQFMHGFNVAWFCFICWNSLNTILNVFCHATVAVFPCFQDAELLQMPAPKSYSELRIH